MDFNHLAEIFENEAAYIRRWATSRSEYEIVGSLERIAEAIKKKKEASKENGE